MLLLLLLLFCAFHCILMVSMQHDTMIHNPTPLLFAIHIISGNRVIAHDRTCYLYWRCFFEWSSIAVLQYKYTFHAFLSNQIKKCVFFLFNVQFHFFFFFLHLFMSLRSLRSMHVQCVHCNFFYLQYESMMIDCKLKRLVLFQLKSPLKKCTFVYNTFYYIKRREQFNFKQLNVYCNWISLLTVKWITQNWNKNCEKFSLLLS